MTKANKISLSFATVIKTNPCMKGFMTQTTITNYVKVS